MTNRIFLVGFMGVGKTTIGRSLAERLSWTFVDLDAEIERCEGQSIAEIFTQKGEDWFRRAEADRLKVVAAQRHQVVSLGGGTYVPPANRALVDALGCSVYLEAPLAVLLDRIGDGEERPLASDRSRLEGLFEDRLPSYTKARATVKTANRAPEDVVLEILQVVGDL